MLLYIRRFPCAGLILLGLLCCGCAALPDAAGTDCRTVNWASVGELDAHLGHPPARFLRYQQRCANQGVTPNRHAYVAGWKRLGTLPQSSVN